jgi:Sulfotransferase domain
VNLLISPPKAGTHLFGFLTNARSWIVALRPQPMSTPLTMFINEQNILDNMAGLDANTNYKGHIPYSQAAAYKASIFDNIILVLRDPRDIIVSMAHAIDKRGGDPINYEYGNVRLSALPFSERIDYLIDNMCPVFRRFEAWRQWGQLDVFSYDMYTQYPRTVIERLSHMGYGRVRDIEKRAKQRAYTYRTARFGDWQNDMTPEQAERVGRTYGYLIPLWNPVMEAV